MGRSSAFTFPTSRHAAPNPVPAKRRSAGARVLSFLYQLVFWSLLAAAGYEWGAGHHHQYHGVSQAISGDAGPKSFPE